MDVTLMIMAATNAHDLPSDKEWARWTLGDIVDGWAAAKYCVQSGSGSTRTWNIKDTISTTKFYFIHIRDIPSSTARRAREVLLGDDVTMVPGPDGLVPKQNRRRRWGFDFSLVPSGARAQLRTNKEITVNWSAVKSYLKDVRANRLIMDSDVA